ncbi:hypothetical protein BD770DRAFT_424994 [Pilaira anomala]|nr:hypothetical protein BD770DRAFT_424994 [Pilaira anomala]
MKIFHQNLLHSGKARGHSSIASKTIADYVDNHNTKDSNNENYTTINSKPLPSLAAVRYDLIEQKCSLLGLEHREDPTVVLLLYEVAKEALVTIKYRSTVPQWKH